MSSASPCVSQEQFDREVAPLSDDDKRWLTEMGWAQPHVEDIRSCASGCSHCIVCDGFCNADWGLYM